MGSYDTIVVDDREFQTKALGKGLRTLSFGAAVRAEYVSFTSEEYNMSPTHPYETLPERYAIEGVEITLADELAGIVSDYALAYAAAEALGLPDIVPSMIDRERRLRERERPTPHFLIENEILTGFAEDLADLVVFDYYGRAEGFAPVLTDTGWRRSSWRSR